MPPVESKKMSMRRASRKVVALKSTRRSSNYYILRHLHQLDYDDDVEIDEAKHIDLAIRLPDNTYTKINIISTALVETLKVRIQVELGIMFEDQQLFNDNVLLENNRTLLSYGIDSDHCEVSVFQQKRYRRIGISSAKIQLVVFDSEDDPSEYHLVDVPAPLPPLSTVLWRIASAIRYLLVLDHLQERKTNKRIWKFYTIGSVTRAIKVKAQQAKKSLSASKQNRQAVLEQHQQKSGILQVENKVLQQLQVASVVKRVKNNLDNETFAPRKLLYTSPEDRTVMEARKIKKWLHGLKYFKDSSISEGAMMDISRHVCIETFLPGTVLFREGDTGNHFYIIVSGTVSLAAEGVGLFATLGPGRCFGEMVLFKDDARRTASALIDYKTPITEMVLIERALYRRSICAFKQAALEESQRLLSTIPALRTLEATALSHLAYCVEKFIVPPKHSFMEQGATVKMLYFLVKGEVKLIQHQADDRKVYAMSVYKAPKVFGQECCIRADAVATFSLQTTRDSTVLCMAIQNLNHTVGANALVYKEVIHEHYQRQQNIQSRLLAAAEARRLKLEEEAQAEQRRLLVASAKEKMSRKRSSRKSTPMRRISIKMATIQFFEDIGKQASNRVHRRRTLQEERDRLLRSILPHPSVLSFQEQKAFARPESKIMSRKLEADRKNSVELPNSLLVNMKSMSALQVHEVPTGNNHDDVEDEYARQYTFVDNDTLAKW